MTMADVRLQALSPRRRSEAARVLAGRAWGFGWPRHAVLAEFLRGRAAGVRGILETLPHRVPVPSSFSRVSWPETRETERLSPKREAGVGGRAKSGGHSPRLPTACPWPQRAASPAERTRSLQIPDEGGGAGSLAVRASDADGIGIGPLPAVVTDLAGLERGSLAQSRPRPGTASINVSLTGLAGNVKEADKCH